jgi:Ca2+-binding RTX toxin-like protein
MLRSFFGSNRKRPRRNISGSFHLESLEGRRVPAGLIQVSFDPGTGTVDVEGSSNGDTIVLKSDQNPNSPLYGLLYVNNVPVIDPHSGKAAFWGEGSKDNAEHIIVHGNGGDDLIRATGLEVTDPYDDSVELNGDGGNDTIIGGGNDECINGGGGADSINGGGGDDTIHGDAGDDQLFGDGGNDCIYGDGGSDYVDGGAGVDFGDGGAGNTDVVKLNRTEFYQNFEFFT